MRTLLTCHKSAPAALCGWSPTGARVVFSHWYRSSIIDTSEGDDDGDDDDTEDEEIRREQNCMVLLAIFPSEDSSYPALTAILPLT